MIYLDNAATTVVRDEVIDIMVKYLKESFGNPSSLYDFGYSVSRDINSCREVIAKYINAKSEEIFFNSCATEGNNTAIFGSISSAKGKNIVSTDIEHSSVYNVFKSLKEKKEIRSLKLDDRGYIDIQSVKNLVDENTEIVSIAYVHNELGVIQDVEGIGKAIKEKNKKCIFHVDSAQAFGKVNIDVRKSKIDILTLSGHKIHAQKGIGAIFVNKNINLRPFVLGGGQEKDFRSGTENVAGIMGLKVATEFMYENLEKRKEYLHHLRELLIGGISEIENHKFLTNENGVPNIVTVAFENIRSEVLLHFLESEKIYISTGSACSKGKKSRTFDGIKLQDKYSDGVVRISMSEFNTEEEIKIFIEKLKKYIDEIRMIMRRGR
ncbi:putative cysteine desulfurase [Parvimonas sp. KA00067]|uniref:cysteine desulfurase family protein n=1 Tax=Parvimonas sp. KA00067 TaxID=1588755 RepID=UPI00079BB74C|nr:cysteine desulfurase family protein [Parvimonas sp. KA00067]KXB66309.1 putative cysteine desulfurase [Parvimonas sp. KA00067]